jgi:hypothetical protein
MSSQNDDQVLQQLQSPVGSDAPPRTRKPWHAPTVILPNCHATAKFLETHEDFLGNPSEGPS